MFMQTHAKYIEDQINLSSFLLELVAQERRKKNKR